MTIEQTVMSAKLAHAYEEAKERARSAHRDIESLGLQTAQSVEKMGHAADNTAKISAQHDHGLTEADGTQAVWLFVLLFVTAFFDLLISGQLMGVVSEKAGMPEYLGWTLPFGIVVVEALYAVLLRRWNDSWKVNRWRLIPAWICAVLLSISIALVSILISGIVGTIRNGGWDDVEAGIAVVMAVVSIVFHLLIFLFPGADVLSATKHIGSRLAIRSAKRAQGKAIKRYDELLQATGAARQEYRVSGCDEWVTRGALYAFLGEGPAVTQADFDYGPLMEALSEVTQRMCARIAALAS